MGSDTIEGFLVDFWEAFFIELDVNDLLSQLDTWQRADLAATEGYDGDLARALGDIRAKAVLAPGEKDLYFPPEDMAWEAEQMPDAELAVIPGVWGALLGLRGSTRTATRRCAASRTGSWPPARGSTRPGDALRRR